MYLPLQLFPRRLKYTELHSLYRRNSGLFLFLLNRALISEARMTVLMVFDLTTDSKSSSTSGAQTCALHFTSGFSKLTNNITRGPESVNS